MLFTPPAGSDQLPGFAGVISASLAPNLAADAEVDIDASFTFEVNTTTSLQSIGDININPTTVLLAGSGDLYVGNSGSQFDITARSQSRSTRPAWT